MKKIVLSIIIVMLLISVFVFLAQVRAPEGTNLYASPAHKTLGPTPLPIGETYTFDVVLENASDVTTIGFDLSFDTSKVNITDITIGNALPGGFLLIGYWNPASGYVDDITVSVLGTSHNVANNTVVTVTVEAMGSTGPEGTVIDIFDMSVWDKYLNELLSGDSPYDHTVYILTPIEPPIASFTWTPMIPEANETVTFNASASTPNGGEIISYQWDFGDGYNASGKMVIHQYYSEGKYTATLNVTDSENLWDIEQKQIRVGTPYVDLSISSTDISFSDSNPSAGQNLTISANVHNLGEMDVENVSVQFFDFITMIGETWIPSISNYSHEVASIPWTPDEEGFHLIKIIVDPYDEKLESNEDNNEATRSILVGEVPPVGGIVVDGLVTPNETLLGYSAVVQGYVVYNTTCGTGEPVAGAKVMITIVGWEEETTYTFRNGTYEAIITTPYVAGNFTIIVTATDHTFSDSIEIGLRTRSETADLHITSEDIVFSDTNPDPGENVTIYVTIHNIGEIEAQNNTVIFYVDDIQLGSPQNISSISAWANETASIQWNASQLESHVVKVIVDTPIESNKNNNIATRGIIVGKNNVAVTHVTTSKTGCVPVPTLSLGYTAEINITVENKGGFIVAFNVTVYVNMTEIGTQSVIELTSGNQATLTFTWNSTGFAYGNYTIIAVATQVPGEINTADNTLYAADEICVTIPGDFNGDFEVGPADFALLSVAYGSTPWQPGMIGSWNPNCDVDGDNKIGPYDFAILGVNYGKHYP